MTATPPATTATTPGWVKLVLRLLAVGVIGAVVRLATFTSPSTPSSATVPEATTTTTSEIPPGAIEKPVETMFQWSQAEQPGPAVFAVGGLVLTLSVKADGDARTPILEVRNPAGAGSSAGEWSFSDGSAEIGVGKLDAASPYNQVVFTTFGSCAHGCGAIRVLDYLDGAWRVIEIGGIEGASLDDFPPDLDGDGKREFQLYDRRFNYAFAAFAASFTPPLIKVLERGVVRDISAERRFAPVYEKYLPAAQTACEAHGNGACAAFVAAAARGGKADAAWAVMLASYDPAADWELPTACAALVDAQTPCPEERKIAFATYPEALRWFLGDTGYMPPVYIPYVNATGPSFDCANVKAETLRLVCATPELARADRELAWLYWRALALSKAPSEVRESERTFIQARNGAPADAFTLLRMYQARLEVLRDAAAPGATP